MKTTSKLTRPSYDDHPTWLEYQEFFPEEMRCDAQTTPTEEWWEWNGIDVHLDRTSSADSALKVIVLHGAGAYGRVMAPAAVIAQRHGYDTVSPDLPGYGLSAVPNARFDYDLWIDCVVDLIEAEYARDGKPIVLFGVSLGGLLAYQAAARSRNVVGLIATTLADTRDPDVRRDFAKTPLLGSIGLWLLQRLAWLIDGLPLPMAWMSKMSNISNEPELSALCMRDRLGGGSWVPARFLRTLMTTPPEIEPENFDECPVLLAHAGEDRMTDIAFSRRFFDRLGGDKRMVVLEGASHMPTELPGLNQLQREVLSFLSAVTPRSSDRSEQRPTGAVTQRQAL